VEHAGAATSRALSSSSFLKRRFSLQESLRRGALLSRFGSTGDNAAPRSSPPRRVGDIMGVAMWGSFWCRASSSRSQLVSAHSQATLCRSAECAVPTMERAGRRTATPRFSALCPTD
jgi:hypothetical protein